MSGRREDGAGKAGSFAAGEGEGGRGLQRKARRPAGGARARGKSGLPIAAEFVMVKTGVCE